MTDSNIYTFSAGRLSLPQFQMFGLVLILIGSYLTYAISWFGIIAILIGLILFLASVGIQIDFDKRSHREFYGIFGFKFGKWKEMPTIEYVTVFIEQYAQRGSMLTIDSTHKFSKVKISLIASRTQRYDGGYFNSKEKAMEAGMFIAKKLNLELLDYTGREPIWIDF